MRTLVSTSVFAFALFAGLPLGVQTARAGQQPEEAKANSVLAEARSALGGEDKLAAVKRLQVNGTTKRANGNFTLDGDTEMFFELPDKFRRNESLTIGGGGGGTGIDRKEIFNGGEFSTEVSGDFGGRGRGRFGGVPGAGGAGGGADGRGTLTPETQERLREFQRRNLQSEVSRLLIALLLTSDTTFRWVGTAQSPEGSADVLEVKTADGVATRVFVDTMTRMPLMLSWTGPAGRGFGRGGQGRRGQGAPDQAGAALPEGRAAGDQPAAGGAPADAAQGRRGRGAQGPPVTLEMHLADYKAVNGIKFPHLITRGASGETNEEWVIKSYKVNPNLKANTFTK